MPRITSASIIVEGKNPGEVHERALQAIVNEMGEEAAVMQVQINYNGENYLGQYLAVDPEFAEQMPSGNPGLPEPSLPEGSEGSV